VLDIPADAGYYSEIMARVSSVPRGHVIATRSMTRKLAPILRRLRARNPNISFQPLQLHAIRPDSLTTRPLRLRAAALKYHDVYWEDEKAARRTSIPRTCWPRCDRAVEARRHRRHYRFRRQARAIRASSSISCIASDPARVRADFEGAGFVFEARSDLLHVGERRSHDPGVRPHHSRQGRTSSSAGSGSHVRNERRERRIDSLQLLSRHLARQRPLESLDART
jgi:hypothetical protein